MYDVISRICPGRHLADASLWIAMAKLLAMFEISKPLDSHGNTIEPDMNFAFGTSIM